MKALPVICNQWLDEVKMKIVVFWLLFSITSVLSAGCGLPLCENNCPFNEVYTNCGGGFCEANCWRKPNSDCCQEGCTCKPGLVRDPNTFQCISPDKCPIIAQPRQCPANEVFSECSAGCQVTCENTNEPVICTYSCVPGCVCKPNYVRNVLGQCIPKSCCASCPPGYAKQVNSSCCYFACSTCPENEEYQDCGTLCEPSCNTPDDGAACPLACKQGCFCKKGFVRDLEYGKCIPKEWCKSQ